MERQVFVSHAADDPDWPPDAIEAVASAIREAGIGVRLDLWHQREMKRHLSLSEWRGWMDAAIRSSTHVVCLVSPRYLRLWERNPEDAGGFGVAFESIRLIHGLYLLKQRSHGRILTLRPEDSDYSCIPPDLVLDCPAYRWGGDRDMLLSHVGEADIPIHAEPPGRAPDQTAAPAPAVVPPAVPRPVTREPAQAAQKPAPVAQSRLPWASDSGEDTYGRWADLTVNGATQRMRWISPSGPEGFWMGSSQAERDAIKDKDLREWANQHEHAPRREIIGQGFWLADTPCTQGFWSAVVGDNPSYFKHSANSPERPVENVSWNHVKNQFIARFAARSDFGAGTRLCLPTEVEWEYAARAGTRTAYWWGDQPDDMQANWSKSTTSVKDYAPNPWCLHDLHGNVWELCADVWQLRRDAPQVWRSESYRVVRGGSWNDHFSESRAASRRKVYCDYVRRYQGFRFALKSPGGPEAAAPRASV